MTLTRLGFGSLFVLSTSFVLLAGQTHAGNGCAGSPDYFKPITNADGQRYPLTIGPVVWHLVGSGIYPVQGSDGMTHVAFAMQFTNVSSTPATISSLQVVDPARGNQPTGNNRVISLKDEDVTGQLKLFSLPPAGDKSSYGSKLGAGQSGVMFFDLSYREYEVPCSLALRLRCLQPESKHGSESTVLGPPLRISSQQAIALVPPVKGDGWLNGNGCCAEVGPHRFVTNPMNGTLDPSEQFAIDWIRINRDGKAFRSDGKKPDDWLCYGTELLAVADGTVVEVLRDLPDEPPGKAPEILKISEIAGNHVVLDLGGGRYAMYAHLAPHSATVHVSDHVHAGQKLGLLGNSGNTTGPHLHFQISDRPSTLDVTSLPFVFESMVLEGRVPLNLDEIENESIRGTQLPVKRDGAKRLKRMMPLSRDLTDFE